MMADLDGARKLLREKFGFDDFLPGQAEAIGALLDTEDVFALWPTGAAAGNPSSTSFPPSRARA
jgi:ATP-dependent DNA helicase RecQ